MNPTSLLQFLQGSFNFLRPDMEEVRRLVPDPERSLPAPRPIYLEDESARPIHGLPLLLSPGMDALRQALGQFILAEEAAQVAALRRETFDRKAYAQAWDRYCALLSRAVENATISSYGRQYPGGLLAPALAGRGPPPQGDAAAHRAPGHRDRPAPRRRRQVPDPRPLPRPRAVHHLRPGAEGGRRHRGGRGGALPAPAHPHARQRPHLHRGLHRPRPRRARQLLQRLAAHRRPRLPAAPGGHDPAGTPRTSPPTASCAAWWRTCCATRSPTRAT